MIIKKNRKAIITVFLISPIIAYINTKSIYISVFCLGYVSLIWIITEFVVNIGLKSKLNSLRTEITKNREIECEGFANYNSRRGYLFLTKSALEFYYSKSKPDLNNFYILLENIRSVYVKGNFFLGEKLIIKTTDEQISFLVDNPKQWELCIKNKFKIS